VPALHEVVVEALDASQPTLQVDALRGTARTAVQQALRSRELAAAVYSQAQAYSGLGAGLKALTQQQVADKLQVSGGWAGAAAGAGARGARGWGLWLAGHLALLLALGCCGCAPLHPVPSPAAHH
jgi:hypothetical protein